MNSVRPGAGYDSPLIVQEACRRLPSPTTGGVLVLVFEPLFWRNTGSQRDAAGGKGRNQTSSILHRLAARNLEFPLFSEETGVGNSARGP